MARTRKNTERVAAQALIDGGFLVRRRERRKAGVTLGNAIRIARALKRDGQEVTSEAIVYEMIEDSPKAFQRVGERDWSSFFEALVKFIEAIMPIIQMFMAFA